MQKRRTGSVRSRRTLGIALTVAVAAIAGSFVAAASGRSTAKTISVAIVANGGEGIDKFDAAIDAAEKANPAGWAGFGSTLDTHGHRDFLARVATMTHK